MWQFTSYIIQIEHFTVVTLMHLAVQSSAKKLLESHFEKKSI